MGKKIKAIKCPQCGSTKQRKIDEEHFVCINCGSGYILDSDDITINHNYNYTGTPPTPLNKKAITVIFSAVTLFFLTLIILSGVLSTKETSSSNGVFADKITWQTETVTQAFFDKNHIAKLFIVGKIGSRADRANNKENKKLYWSVYNVSTGKTEQLHLFEDISGHITLKDIQVTAFDDGKIYFVFKKTKVYSYTIADNSLVYLNNDLEQKIEKLKSGIGSIQINLNYNSLDIISNTGAKVSYYPSTGLQVSPADGIQNMPNPILQTKYAASISNPNYLVRYEALQQVGYPVFTKPAFYITFDEKEEPTNVTVSEQDRQKAFVKKYSIVPTTKRMHKLIVLGSSSGNIAIAYKENIQEGEKYTIALLDSLGKAKWNLKTQMGIISNENNILSPKNDLMVIASNGYYLINKGGNIIKTVHLEDITLNPNK